MAVLESDIRALFKVITSETMKTVRAGQKTILSPTTVRNLASEISAQAESGSIAKFEAAINKTESIIEKLGINLDDFNKGLSNRIKELSQQKIKAEAEVQELRQSNIAAEVRTIKEGKEFRIETNILTRKEIKERTALLNQQIKQTDKREKEIIKEREKLLSKDKLSNEDKQKIIADEKELAQKREVIAREQGLLSGDQTVDPTGGRLEVPPMLAGFADALMAPFTAIKDAGLQLKDTVVGVGESLMFLGKAGIKGLGKAFKAMAFILKPIPLAIGAAIAAAVFIIYKFRDRISDFVDFIKGIPATIGNFIKDRFIEFTDFIKSMINTVIKLVNIIPRVNIPLLETSAMRDARAETAEDKKKEFQSTVKEAEQDFQQKQEIEKELQPDLQLEGKDKFDFFKNLDLLKRKDINMDFASAADNMGQGNNTNFVQGGAQVQTIATNNSVNVMSHSKNPDNTIINLNGAVPV